MNVKKIITLLCLALILGFGCYLIYPHLKPHIASLVKSTEEFAVNHTETVDELKNEIYSTPLTGTNDSKDARLTIKGVITLSNSERQKQNVSTLKENAKLDAAAKAKVDDMFKQQYFEHISPDGRGPGYLAEDAGYTYIIVGENLALGNFKDDAALVAAWMASPGHKANILNNRFTEIGVAVAEGMYKGKKTWLAVQEFGLPSSACPALNTSLKADIDMDTDRVKNMDAKLKSLKNEVDTMPHYTEQEEDAYNKKIAEYNALVADYNTRSKQLQTEIEEYNKQVRMYNACIQGK